jgi:hypothetical protein
MGYRPGDPTETFEGKVLLKTPKSRIVELTLGGKYFVPDSQVVEMGEPDLDGNREFEVTTWWWDKRHDFEAD